MIFETTPSGNREDIKLDKFSGFLSVTLYNEAKSKHRQAFKCEVLYERKHGDKQNCLVKKLPFSLRNAGMHYHFRIYLKINISP